MSSTKEFKDYILDQLRELDDVACRAMMGEFLLYYHGVVFGGIYDDKLLIKKTQSNKKYRLTELVPYKNAKPMYMVENIDDIEYLCSVVKETYLELKK